MISNRGESQQREVVVGRFGCGIEPFERENGRSRQLRLRSAWARIEDEIVTDGSKIYLIGLEWERPG